MNVIDAAWRFGRALSVHNWCGCRCIETAEWGAIIGTEMSIRLQELLDNAYRRYGFNGAVASLSILEELGEPADDKDPVNYWIALRNVISECDEFSSYAKALQEIGLQVDLISKELFGMATDVDNLAGMPSALLLCRDELVVAIKRTGALRQFRESLVLDNPVSISELEVYISEREEAINSDFMCIFDEPSCSNSGLCSDEARSAIDGIMFLNSLVNRATLWGFLNAGFSAKACETSLSGTYGEKIARISMHSENGLLMANRVFSAIALRREDDAVVGYLVPSKMSLQFSNSTIDYSCSGLFYPSSDKGLFLSEYYCVED